MIDDSVLNRLAKNKTFNEKWVITSILGKGAQGIVYKAYDKNNYDKVVALKVVPLGDDFFQNLDVTVRCSSESEYWQEQKKMVLEEIHIMQKFNDCKYMVHIEAAYEFPWDDGKGTDIVIQMEYLKTAHQYLQEQGISEKEILTVARDICNALVYIEKENLVHGDIKIANLYYAEDHYKLGDFGITQTIGSKSFWGTSAYIAPETLKQGEKSSATDIYAVGILLYLLAGGNKEDAIKHTVENKALKVENVEKKFAEIILRACEVDKSRRIANAKEMLECLEKIKNPSENKIPFAHYNKTKRETTENDVTLELSEEGTVEEKKVKANVRKEFCHKLLSWIFSSCILALMPLTIYVLFGLSFKVDMSSKKFITEMLYLGLTLSITTVKDLVELKKGWKKYRIAYILILSILFIIIVLTAVFFGMMTAYDMNILDSKMKSQINESFMCIMTMIMAIVSAVIGAYVQYLGVE